MHTEVQHYYGNVLQSSADLKTDACCTVDALPQYAKDGLAKIHDEIIARYYGCGLVLPEALEGARILDLGCGTGRDCYLLSYLVGAKGHVVGVDMTSEQLAFARRHQDYHTSKFGFPASNTEFREANIENLESLGFAENHFDLIVSNCVINLAMDKQAVFDQAYRLLKPGGELYFADIYTDRRVSEELKADPVLYGECLSGALYWHDFLNQAGRAGFVDPRLVNDRPVTITLPEIRERVGPIRFFAATYRLFKLPGLETGREDYGQTVRYLGTVPHHPERVVLDKHHVFETGKTEAVCSNTFRMLAESRLAPFFELHEALSRRHHGVFPGPDARLPFEEEPDITANSGRAACC